MVRTLAGPVILEIQDGSVGLQNSPQSALSSMRVLRKINPLTGGDHLP